VPEPETNAPDPYITIRAGGPFDGVVTVTALERRSLVEAAWTMHGGQRTDRLEVSSVEEANGSRILPRTIGGRSAARSHPPVTNRPDGCGEGEKSHRLPSPKVA
jgi:hypothetical protein